MDSRLKQACINMLRDRRHDQTFAEIERATNIPWHWISQLEKGLIEEPSVVRCETLYRYLSGKDIVL